jgi:integrase
MAHRAVMVAVETGLRVSDLCRVGDGDVDRDGLISLIAHKNRRYGEKARVNVPVSDALAVALAATPTVVPIGARQWLWTVTGKAFSDDYLGECISGWAREAGVPGRSVHGLRKTFVRRMIDAGHHPNDVAAMTGHQDLKLVMFYADKRDKRLSALRVKAASKGAA